MYIFKSCALALSIVVGSSSAATVDDVDNQSSAKSSLRGRIRNLLEGASLNNNAVVSSTHQQRKLSVGCYETYVEGQSYAINAYVSYVVTDSNFPKYVLNEDTGLWELDDESAATTRYNYKCNSIRCGDAMYGPGESGESLAWEQVEECDADLPTKEAPLLDLWDDIYCPQAFDVSEEDYEGGELRELGGVVYQCAASPQNEFCSMDGYEPNMNAHISTVWVWEQLGRCTGTFPPTPNPINAYPDVGGCFCDYNKDETYVAGDKVSVKQDGVRVIYQCKSAPSDRWCSSGISSYVPGTGEYWDMAWTLVGTCDGTIEPTLQPTMDPLANVGGCPSEWEEWTNIPGQTQYEEGDLVSLNGLVYKCNSAVCSSAGYQPEEDVATPGAWKQAWALMGYCSGSLAPTKAPHFETLEAIEGGCPDGWDEEAEYEQGDLVAVVISNGFGDTSEEGGTRRPSSQPITPSPKPTSQFCFSPTSSPSTSTSAPFTVSPSSSPTSSPTTASPSKSPTQNPTDVPTGSPSKEPTSSPIGTSIPSQSTSPSQTVVPTTETKIPTRSPTPPPSVSPSSSPTASPSQSPTKAPSSSPSQSPTPNPTSSPTPPFPTDSPSKSSVPSSTPSQSSAPSDSPSDSPSTSSPPTLSPPSSVPSSTPSQSSAPSDSASPSTVPSTLGPTKSPSNSPTIDDGVRIVVYKCDVGPAYCSQFDPTDGTGLGWKAVGHCRSTFEALQLVQ